MTSLGDSDSLYEVLTASEAAKLWGLHRNAVRDAIRRGALRGRQSGNVWLVTVGDMLTYQRGRYFTDIPPELRPAFDRALAAFRAGDEAT